NDDGMEDWNGLDFGHLGGRLLDAAQNALSDNGVPFVTVTCEEPMTDDRIGELLYFVEFSSALTAAAQNLPLPERAAAWQLLEKPE
ncbi:MAG: hypothetical protein Q3977_01180, partial [Oscillospiraceae bacterium]|nr:hypothetical protein [Oscillospiraceae bacterium]